MPDLLVAGGCFTAYLVLSVRRYVEGQATGFDLGIFTQVVKSYADLTPPYVPLKGPHFNALGDHFHPILALIAPFYRVFPSPVTLLVIQAALAAVPVVPLMRWARTDVGARFAWWIGLSYGGSWGIAELLGFDFHEVACGVPLVAYAVCALGQRRWTAAALWALPLVLVKEDLGLTVAAIGAFIAWQGPRRRGVVLAVLGLAASAIEICVILPAINPAGHFAYTGLDPSGLAWPSTKWLTVLLLLAPTGFLATRSPLLVVALPTLGWRFAATNPHYWGTHFHYSAVLMPVVFGAAIQAAPTVGPRARRCACWVGGAVTVVTFFTHPLHSVVSPSTWGTDAHLRAVRAVLAEIPDGATVAASNQLAAQLAARTTVSEVCLSPGSLPTRTPPQWLVYDASDPTQEHCTAGEAISAASPIAPRYRLVDRRSGVTLMRREHSVYVRRWKR
ncbi:DUF2079 domain-containing protein [Nocardioides ultimimeridianus]